MNRYHNHLRPGRAPHRLLAALLVGLAALGALWAGEAAAQAGAAESAVILVYQRFGEGNKSENSVKLADFDAHIGELTGGRFNVMPLPDILAAIEKGEKLPNRTVAVTIDDSFRSVYDRAWPRLKKAGIPFTLFVSTDPADRKLAGYMTWDEIRELKAAGATIGSHTAGFLPLSETTLDGFREDVVRSVESFEQELGERPTLFSWPRGEMGAAAARMLEDLGFKAAFGYHSGPTHSLADRMMLPRFPMVGNYARNNEFQLRVNTLALPLINVSPADPMLSGAAPARFSFMIDPSAGRVRGFNCFHSSQGQLELRQVGDRQYEADLDPAALNGVWRINCTMPTGGKRFRWWGMQYYSAH